MFREIAFEAIGIDRRSGKIKLSRASWRRSTTTSHGSP
jgi:hypothetical protein